MESKTTKKSSKKIDKINEKMLEIRKILKERGPNSQVGLSELDIKDQTLENMVVDRIKESDAFYYIDTKRIIKKKK